MHLSAKTRGILLDNGIEIESFIKWFEALPAIDKTPKKKMLYGLLSPRPAMGGWFSLKESDFHNAIGKEAWDRFARYVDGHLDDAWIRVCIGSLGLGMGLGLLCLFARYFGINNVFFHPTEFGVIILLVCLEITFAYFIITLSMGLHAGESAVSEAITRAVIELKPLHEKWVHETSHDIAKEIHARAKKIS
jgi:hypothetical protein